MFIHIITIIHFLCTFIHYPHPIILMPILITIQFRLRQERKESKEDQSYSTRSTNCYLYQQKTMEHNLIKEKLTGKFINQYIY